MAKQSRMGQFVFTAGNALGDGIVTRSGNITSFTPEPINGDWNEYCYSAPASPGNSGGPLLNKSLEVVGVVVRRTESENLNFAIPLKELDAVKSAEFFRRDVKIEKFKKQLGKDWNFSTNTPATMNEITQKAHSDFLKFYLALQGEFQKKYANDIFPSDPKVKDWARDSLSYTLAGVIQKDNADRWVTAPVEWTLHKLETNRTLAIEKNAEGGSVAFMLERPKNKKLKDFISDPKGILDAFMKQVRWNRPYAGRQIPVKSYGKPKYANKWTDIYGRNWRDYEWVTSFDDRSLQMNCLHMPAGVFCMFDYVPYRLSELNKHIHSLRYRKSSH